jgi:signal transduction histidine kinase
MCIKVLVLAWWLGAIGLPIAAVLGLVAWIGEPRIGLDVTLGSDGRMEITRVHPGGPAWASGVRIGDVLVWVDGTDIDQVTWVQRQDNGVNFLVERQATTEDPPKRIVGGLPPLSPRLVGSFWVIGGIFAIASFFIFARTRRSLDVLVLSLMFMAFAVAFGLAPAAARWHPWAVFAESLIADGAILLFISFFFLFSSRQQASWPAARYAIWGMAALGATLAILYSISFTVLPEVFTVARPILLAHEAAGLIGGVFLLCMAYWRSSSQVLREQSRIMLIGVAAAVLPFALLSVSPQVIGLGALLRPEVIVLSIILVPLSFTYAIMRHQLMGIRRLVHKGAAYTLISLMVFIIYGGMIATLRILGGPGVSENLAVQVLLLVVLFGAVPSISGIRRLAFAAVDRLLYREYLDHSALSRKVSVTAASAQSFGELQTRGLETVVGELRLCFAAFIRVAYAEPTVKVLVGHLPTEVSHLVSAMASEHGGESLSYVEINTGHCPGQAILVPIMGRPDKGWILCLGPKTTEEPFSGDDLGLAQSIASHFATLGDNLELLEDLQSKTLELRQLNRRLFRTQEEERSRIASYLHDEPLNQISNLIWRHGGVDLPPSVQKELQGITEDLRSFTARLQPGVLEDLGLVRALEWLGSEAAATAGFKFILDAGTVGRDHRLEQEVELAIYRISQEALANCQRHARAKTVHLSLWCRGNTIGLQIEDDGKGLLKDQVAKPGIRLGLIGIRERAEQLGGRVQISDRKPSGTRVQVWLPLSPGNFDPQIRNESGADD